MKIRLNKPSVVLLCACLLGLLLLAGCANGSSVESNQPTGQSADSAPYDKNNFDDILSYIESQGNDASDAISEESEALVSSLGDSYDSSLVSSFYDKSDSVIRSFRENVKAAVIDYCRCVAGRGDAIDSLNECYKVWEAAANKVYNDSNTAYGSVSGAVSDAVQANGSEADFEEAKNAFQASVSTLTSDFDDIRADVSILSDVAQCLENGGTDIEDVLAGYEAR